MENSRVGMESKTLGLNCNTICNIKNESMSFTFDRANPCDKTMMKLLALVLQTGFLKEETVPLSLLMMAKAGIGKSRLLKILKDRTYRNYVYSVTDITPKFLVNDFLEKCKKGKYRFICIGDFTNITDSHSVRTGSTIVSILRNITEEGSSDIKDFGMEFSSEGRDVKAGLITSTTKSSLSDFRRSWKSSGFLSRPLPFSFEHSPQTQRTILDEINNDSRNSDQKLPYKINKHPPKVEIDSDLMKQFEPYSLMLAKETGSAPYRAQLQFRKLIKSNCVLNGRNRIEKQDFYDIGELLQWINYDFKAI